jgi:hypothetical protein
MYVRARVDQLVLYPYVRGPPVFVGGAGTGQQVPPVSRYTSERAVKLFGHSAFGWGALIREFLRRPEGAAMRLVCPKLCETVDGLWTFPCVRWSRGEDGDGDGDICWSCHSVGEQVGFQ